MTNRNIVFSLFACLLIAFSAFGQASMTSTTLSAAMDASQQFALVASATGVNAPSNLISGGVGNPSGNAITLLYVDQEAMRVNAISSTRATVQRGVQGTKPVAHASGAKVWVGPPSYFAMVEPSGTCTASLLTVLPRVVIPSGNIWNCGNSVWTTFGSFPSRMTVGAVLSAAATLTITNPIHHVTAGATTITTITAAALPATGGCIVLIPDGTAYTTSTASNIALATTLVASKALTMCYDTSNSKWYPSY